MRDGGDGGDGAGAGPDADRTGDWLLAAGLGAVVVAALAALLLPALAAALPLG